MLKQWFNNGKSSRLVHGLGFAALMSSLLLCVLTPARAETWTGRKDGCGEPGASLCGDNGTWGDKYNWSSETVPGAQDDVTIAFGTINGGARIIKSLTVTGGSPGFDSLLVKETLQVSAGEIGVTTTLQTGILTMSGGLINTPVGLLKGDREQDRVFNWTGGVLVSPNFQIPIDGKLIISGTSPKYVAGRIINEGTATAKGRGVTGGLPTGGSGNGFTNKSTGTFTVSGDFLFHQDSASQQQVFDNEGIFIKDGGGTTDMSLFVLNNTGTGIVRVENGTLVTTLGGTGNGDWTVLPGAVLDLSNFGLYRFESGTTIAGGGLVRLTTGLVYCAADVTFGTVASPTTFLLNGGTIGTNAPQKFSIASGSTMNWTSGSLNGILDVTQGGKLVISGAADKTFDGSVINNAGLTTWTGPGLIRSGLGSQFNNLATGNWRLLTDGDVFGSGVNGGTSGTHTNAGTLSKYGGTGTTNFVFGLANTGILEAKSGILVSANDLTLDTGSRFIGAGTHRLLGGSVAGNTTVEGTVELLSGTLFSNTDTPVFKVASGGIFNWKGGYLNAGGVAPGVFTIATGGKLNISGPAIKEFNRITNAGTTTLDGGGDLTGYAGVFTNTGTFNALNGATLIAGAYNNAGHSTFLNEGTLNIGTPGTAGTFNVTLSNYTQTATGRLNVDIGGASSFDKLNLNGLSNPGVGGGTATLAGKVNVSLLNGFVPPPDSLYRVMPFLAQSGEFSQIVDGNPTDKRTFAALYNATSFSLKALQVPPLLTIGNATIAENNAGGISLNFPVTLSFASDETVTAAYATSNGTATAGKDYTATSGTLTFAPGQIAKTITVPILGDTTDEDDEQFNLTLNNSKALPATVTVTGTIRDEDGPPGFSINDISISESNSGKKFATFTVLLSALSEKTTGITCYTADGTARTPSDYTAKRVNLSFGKGQITSSFSVELNGDTTDEINEVFYALLTLPINAGVAKARGVCTITNDDLPPTVSIDDVSLGEGQGGTRSIVFHLRLAQVSGKVVKVNFATALGTTFPASAGTDFVAVPPTTVSISAGTTIALARVVINGDLLDEENETFKVNLSSPVNATILDGQGIGTILDDDAAPSLSINDVSIQEGNGGTKTLSFTVTQSGITAKTVAVNFATADGTARSTSDYTAKSGTLSFVPGSALSKSISITINGDTVAEGDESFFVFLSGALNASIGKARGVGIITNDDASG